MLQSCPDFEYVEFDGEEFFFKVEPQYANFEHTILDALEYAGVELNFEQQQTKDSGMVMGGM